jgi:subtilisin family serine protease
MELFEEINWDKRVYTQGWPASFELTFSGLKIGKKRFRTKKIVKTSHYFLKDAVDMPKYFHFCFTMKRYPYFITAAVLGLSLSTAYAQPGHKISVPLPENAAIEMQWQHADAEENGILGVSSYKAAAQFGKGKNQVPVVVAVIDSGTETFHPDLSKNIWVNADEIPDNGKDDDNNGYIDDVNGWSFIGGKDGDVAQDNLEFTRVYNSYRKRFENKLESQITSAEKSDYAKYLDLKKQYDGRLTKAQEEKQEYEGLMAFIAMAKEGMKASLGKENYTLDELKAYQPDSEMNGAYKELMIAYFENDLENELKGFKEHVENQFKYSYNLDFDPRGIVGDNYADPRQRDYGNNHVNGPEAEHGTHVAGIIGATRSNGGMDGICSTAQIMVLRCVPNGDERDKDVANAIRYAVDNGAKVINMSFGKSLSPNKDVVDEAVKYAESKGVLLVHAAGNDAKNVDKADNFPTKKYLSGGSCSTWIEVGASGPKEDELMASFSNYGKKNVDVFAPGVEIYSTMTNDSFKKESGTSMASPVTAGVAAALWSYYPELTAQQVKEIIEKSAVKYKSVEVPDPAKEGKKTKFGKMSKTGAIVNLCKAMELAEAKYAKK